MKAYKTKEQHQADIDVAKALVDAAIEALEAAIEEPDYITRMEVQRAIGDLRKASDLIPPPSADVTLGGSDEG